MRLSVGRLSLNQMLPRTSSSEQALIRPGAAEG